jgi:hypothetical protein
MGKRSSFACIPRDHYPTPMMAVEPLVPHLRAEGIRSFAEPCDGGKHGGHLVQHLESFGFVCAYRADIADGGRDAHLITAQDVRGSDAIITNPPHSRTLMHELLLCFVAINLPVWLLVDLDWVSNLAAAPYLSKCSDVIPIGRVKWVPGTEHSGKENYGWLRFHATHDGPTAIRNNRQRRIPAILECREGN